MITIPNLKIYYTIAILYQNDFDRLKAAKILGVSYRTVGATIEKAVEAGVVKRNRNVRAKAHSYVIIRNKFNNDQFKEVGRLLGS